MACDCLDKVDEMLASRNTRLVQAIRFGKPDGNPNLMLQTEQIEKGRGKPKAVGMFLSHCPFCGKRYA